MTDSYVDLFKWLSDIREQTLISEASLLKTLALIHNAFDKSQQLILQLILYLKIHECQIRVSNLKIHFKSEVLLDTRRQASFRLAIGFMSLQLFSRL